jgi:hypothetical protein
MDVHVLMDVVAVVYLSKEDLALVNYFLDEWMMMMMMTAAVVVVVVVV